ncbi:MAG: hypothetical protein IKX40_13960 [Thermoguttaceae bacterium]|nr:hypothetical protein [Thermoguttaceae bacterium]
MKSKTISLTLIAAMALQLFAAAMPGDLSTFGNNNQSRQTFIDSGTAPFIAFDETQKAKQLRYNFDSLDSCSSPCLYNVVVFTGHSSIKADKAFVRPQINSPLLI